MPLPAKACGHATSPIIPATTRPARNAAREPPRAGSSANYANSSAPRISWSPSRCPPNCAASSSARTPSRLTTCSLPPSPDALSEKLATDKGLRAAIHGFTAVLHTWNQRLGFHPHIHCLVPGAGLNAAGQFVRVKNPEFLRLSASVAGRLSPALLSAVEGTRTGQSIRPSGTRTGACISNRPAPARSALKYLGTYVARTAITDARIVAVDQTPSPSAGKTAATIMQPDSSPCRAWSSSPATCATSCPADCAPSVTTASVIPPPKPIACACNATPACRWNLGSTQPPLPRRCPPPNLLLLARIAAGPHAGGFHRLVLTHAWTSRSPTPSFDSSRRMNTALQNHPLSRGRKASAPRGRLACPLRDAPSIPDLRVFSNFKHILNEYIVASDSIRCSWMAAKIDSIRRPVAPPANTSAIASPPPHQRACSTMGVVAGSASLRSNTPFIVGHLVSHSPANLPSGLRIKLSVSGTKALMPRPSLTEPTTRTSPSGWSSQKN